MTAATLVLPGIQLVSKTVRTTAGSYDLSTPPGASFAVIRARGASGSATAGNDHAENGLGIGAASGNAAFVQALIRVAATDSIGLVVGRGGIYGADEGGGLSSLSVDGTTKLIVAGSGAAVVSSFPYGGEATGGDGGIASGVGGSVFSFTNYSGSSYTTTTDGTGASGSTNGTPPGGTPSGGHGYGNGGAGGQASGGGSSFIDPSLARVTSGAITAADADLGNAGRSVRTAGSLNVPGIDGGIVIEFWTGDPFAAGLRN